MYVRLTNPCDSHAGRPDIAIGPISSLHGKAFGSFEIIYLDPQSLTNHKLGLLDSGNMIHVFGTEYPKAHPDTMTHFGKIMVVSRKPSGMKVFTPWELRQVVDDYYAPIMKRRAEERKKRGLSLP